MPTTDQESLAVRFHHGEEPAMTELYQTFARRIHATAMRLLGDHDLAAETVQRTFLRAWRAADHYDPSRELQPWLYAIARRTAIDVYRTYRGPVEVTLAAADQAAPEPDPLESYWVNGEVHAALARLSLPERRVLRLAYFDGLSQSEIAAVDSLPIGTVKSRTARALRHLARLLAHLN